VGLPQAPGPAADAPGHGGAYRLVSYLVPADGAVLDAAAVRERLDALLPAHMVPPTVVFLPSLPTTDRGKVDRGALPVPPA